MRYVRFWWVVAWVFLFIPYLLLMAAGAVHLVQSGYFLWWLAGGGAASIIGWGLSVWLRRRRIRMAAVSATADPRWSPLGEQAWVKVEEIAKRVEAQNPPLNDPQWMWPVLREILETVAVCFQPKSKHPELEIPVPHVLKIIEIVARDLRQTATENLPGAHILTLRDFQRMQKAWALGERLYLLYRLAYLALNPSAALMNEARIFLAGKLTGASAEDLRRWGIGFSVRKAGYYAIQLYSGHLTLEEVEFSPKPTSRSREDWAASHETETRLADEPLRILVLGQVKAGKSSLINALFGETRAAVDVVPRTRRIEPFKLEREGQLRAIILDTAGYDDPSGIGAEFDELSREVLQCDLVLLACKATSAARSADRALLDEVRAFYQKTPSRRMPPVVAALTHIDQLRPVREWNPPYDVAAPQTGKARQIRQAMGATAADLQIDESLVMPVCLAEGRRYNVEEGLVPAILQSMDQADRVKYLRCLEEHRKEEYWRLLWLQSANAGRILYKKGKEWAGKTARRVGQLARTSLDRDDL